MSSAQADIFTDDKNAAALRKAGADGELGSWLKAHLARASSGDYFALLDYIERNHAHIDALQHMRLEVRDTRHVATCAEFGPRFLHSTGQAYKGGPDSGVFLQITSDDAQDLPVPGQKSGPRRFRRVDRARPARVARASKGRSRIGTEDARYGDSECIELRVCKCSSV
jgi:transaldolase/glucose-6-phosphate isomerase